MFESTFTPGHVMQQSPIKKGKQEPADFSSQINEQRPLTAANSINPARKLSAKDKEKVKSSKISKPKPINKLIAEHLILSGQLDPICIKIWNLIRPVSDNASTGTVTTKDRFGQRSGSAVSQGN